MSDTRRLASVRSSWDIVHVELVPAGPGEEMQAASAADDLDACRERLPAGEHHPVLSGGLGAVGAEFGHGKPVMIGAVAAEQRDTGAPTARALKPLMSLCQPVERVSGLNSCRRPGPPRREPDTASRFVMRSRTGGHTLSRLGPATQPAWTYLMGCADLDNLCPAPPRPRQLPIDARICRCERVHGTYIYAMPSWHLASLVRLRAAFLGRSPYRL
jgi:hypothetical protein